MKLAVEAIENVDNVRPICISISLSISVFGDDLNDFLVKLLILDLVHLCLLSHAEQVDNSIADIQIIVKGVCHAQQHPATLPYEIYLLHS